MIKGYKIRLYPTKEQEILFKKHIGCCRFIYNYMLNLQNELYSEGKKHLSAVDMCKLLTPLKKNEVYSWLREVSNKSLQRVCRDLDKAYQNFFGGNARHPKFKSKKKSRLKFPICIDNFYFKSETLVHVEKCGFVACSSDIRFPLGRGTYRFKNPRIELVCEKWILTFSMEYENQVQNTNDFSMGIDLGIKELAVVSCNGQEYVFHNINKSKKIRDIEKKINYVHSCMDRKFNKNRKHTNNWERDRQKLKKLYARRTGIRNNYLHQTTRFLVNLMPKTVIMEDLDISRMIKDKFISKYILDQKWYEFIRQIKYKCEWAGIEFVQVDQYYPSSKTCSHCGHIKKDLKLSDRIYKCPICGLEIDRDLNAARNLEKYIA